MTVADLLRVLLELDQQCLTSRPSPWGEAAELVASLARYAAPNIRDFGPEVLGDWRSVDLSPVRKPAPPSLSQPTLDAIRALEADPLPLTSTQRGILYAEFFDRSGRACSIQESSDATEPSLWIGRDTARMHFDRRMVAALLPHLEHFAATGRLGSGEGGTPCDS